MTEPSRAVFLSYASQDSEAARRICEALRAAGIEVWIDQNELRGGDAWDRKIREQIYDCRLFVPIISAHSEARDEGYFRREWKLAVDRTHDMAEKKAFLVPVVVDDTSERGASVPEKFREMQWTRLPGGNTPGAFVERIQRLLSGETASPPDRVRLAGGAGGGGAPTAAAIVRRKPRVVYGAIAVVSALAVGYFALERLTRLKPSTSGAASIAVLPLANESGEASQQYFSDGISEDLITALGQFPGLKVIGRTSSFQFRDSKEDSRSIGVKLGVGHLLEGSVRKSGDTIRVSAELIDTTDGAMQWSERYDRPYKDLFALQDEITHNVASALRTKLLPGESAVVQSERPPSGSLEAYNALLQGQFYVSRGTGSDVRKAIESFTQATQLDPRYALAWSALSQAWVTLGGRFLEGAPIEEARANAGAAAERALALSPELAAAHAALGLVRTFNFDWRGAETEYRRALVLSPNDAAAQFFFARAQATFGAPERAVELTRQALASDPLRATWYAWLASYLGALNRLDEAERAVRRAIELHPVAAVSHQRLAIIEIQKGDAQAALAAAQQEPPGSWQDSALALAMQIGSDRGAADAALKTLIDKDAAASAYQVAQVYALRKDAQQTFGWLDRAFSNRDSGILYLLFDPFILRFKDDPRFVAFCQKVGLPAPGEKTAAGKST